MDEVYLSNHISPRNLIKLTPAKYVDSLESPKSSLRTPNVLEMLASFDYPADKLVV